MGGGIVIGDVTHKRVVVVASSSLSSFVQHEKVAVVALSLVI